MEAGGDNKFQFGLVADFVLRTPGGTVLGGKDGFLDYKVVSRAQMQEFMLNIAINFNGIKPGDYVLTFTIHDVNDPKRTTSVDQPTTIVQ